jgi:hypothetical protein
VVNLQGFFRKEGYLYKELFGCIPRVHVLVHDLQCEFPSLSACLERRHLNLDIESLTYDSRGMMFSRIEGHEFRLHETKPKPSLEVLRAFSEQFTGMEPIELDIPLRLLEIIETCSV